MPAKTNDLFSIEKIEHTDGTIRATLGINQKCEIFKGHFPGQPVVPGACMLQIVKEVLENALETPLRLKKAGHLKFISMLDPNNTQLASIDILYQLIDTGFIVTAKLMNGETVCFKFQGTFSENSR